MLFFYEIGNCSYNSGIPTRIALAILGVQSAGFALFYGIGNCSYSSGTYSKAPALHFFMYRFNPLFDAMDNQRRQQDLRDIDRGSLSCLCRNQDQWKVYSSRENPNLHLAADHILLQDA